MKSEDMISMSMHSAILVAVSIHANAWKAKTSVNMNVYTHINILSAWSAIVTKSIAAPFNLQHE